MSEDDPKPEDDKQEPVPEKYRQTHPEEAHRGQVPGEPYRARKENRKRVLPTNKIAPGTDFDPITGA